MPKKYFKLKHIFNKNFATLKNMKSEDMVFERKT